VGTPVDFESRLVEWVKEASRSSINTMQRVGIRPMSWVSVLSLILRDELALINTMCIENLSPFRAQAESIDIKA
jgi:hypothetical protein